MVIRWLDANTLDTNIRRIPIPTPFAVGNVNCYLIHGEPLTLVDTGPNWGTAMNELESGLERHETRIEDLELIVLTHHHADHAGLLQIIVERSGAQVAGFGPLQPWIAEYPSSIERHDLFVQAMLRRHGVPHDVATVTHAAARTHHAFGSQSVITRPLFDGDSLRMGGRDFKVHHRPGHSPADLLFADESSGVLIGGDHLIAHMSANALVTAPLSPHHETARRQPLLEYAESLRATKAMNVTRVLPGHGETIADHATLIETRLAQQDQRAEKILSVLQAAPLSAHGIARRIWNEVAVTQAYLTLSQVLGHLDVLLADGRVMQQDEHGSVLFAAV